MTEDPWILPWLVPVMRMVGKAPYRHNLREEELLDILRTAGFEVTEGLNQRGMVPRLFTVARKPYGRVTGLFLHKIRCAPVGGNGNPEYAVLSIALQASVDQFFTAARSGDDDAIMAAIGALKVP